MRGAHGRLLSCQSALCRTGTGRSCASTAGGDEIVVSVSRTHALMATCRAGAAGANHLHIPHERRVSSPAASCGHNILATLRQSRACKRAAEVAMFNPRCLRLCPRRRLLRRPVLPRGSSLKLSCAKRSSFHQWCLWRSALDHHYQGAQRTARRCQARASTHSKTRLQLARLPEQPGRLP